MVYSRPIEMALEVAVTAHHGQMRRGCTTPYSVHPIHMALMIARFGLDEWVILAAILHDVVEDCAEWDVARVERDFGGRVADIVSELTEDKTKSWRERKEAGIDNISRMSAEAAAVKAVDQLHNLESLYHALATAPDPGEVWSHFRGGREGTLEVAARKVAALEKRVDLRLAHALRAVLARISDFEGVGA